MVHHLNPPFQTPPPPSDRQDGGKGSFDQDAASTLATSRTAYSLAREVLCLRTELKTERDQAIHNLNLFDAASQQHQVAQRRANELERTLAQMEAEEGQEILALREDLDEVRAVMVNAMLIEPAELEPPIRKQSRDVDAAQRMERKHLEQRYALARMTARLSMAKAEEIEKKLALELDESQTLALQMTATAMNLRNRCKELELETARPVPRTVRRTGDQSLELTFHSCRLAGEFERFITQGEMPA